MFNFSMGIFKVFHYIISQMNVYLKWIIYKVKRLQKLFVHYIKGRLKKWKRNTWKFSFLEIECIKANESKLNIWKNFNKNVWKKLTENTWKNFWHNYLEKIWQKYSEEYWQKDLNEFWYEDIVKLLVQVLVLTWS